MKKLSFLLIFLVSVISLYAQPYIKKMGVLLTQKQYNEALNYGIGTIKSLKGENKSDKQLEMLTYLSMCLNPLMKDQGCKAINDYFGSHKLALNRLSYFSKYLNFSRQVCEGQTNAPIPAADEAASIVIYVNGGHIASLGGHFKSYGFLQKYADFNSLLFKVSYDNLERIMGYHNPSGNVQIDTSAITTPYRMIPVARQNVDSLSHYIENIYHSKNYFKSTHFVLVSRSYTKAQFTTTASILEKTLNFYHENLHIPFDPNLIFVYLSSSFNELYSDINRIDHKGVYHESIIGYSNIAANAIFAWIPSPTGPGTVKHELIHVLLKNNPLYPEWFEEGLASLYEESRFFPNNELLGTNNWRLNFLRYLSTNQLYELMDGVIFNDPDAQKRVAKSMAAQVKIVIDKFRIHDKENYKNYERSTFEVGDELAMNLTTLCNDALSRYFLAYLQSKSKIGNIIQEITNNQNELYFSGKYVSFLGLISGELNVSDKAALEKGFSAWLALQSAAQSHITNTDFQYY